MSDLERPATQHYDEHGNPLPPFKVKSPSPDFGDDAQGARIREANRSVEATEKRRTNRNILIGAGSAAAALALVGGGLLLKGNGHNTAPKAEVSTSASPNPGNKSSAEANPSAPTNPEINAQVTPTELTVERYGHDGDALARAFTAEMNTWMMANATEANEKAWSTSSDSLKGWAQKVSDPTDKAFEKALFVEDWEQRPQLAASIRQTTDLHATIVATNMATTNSDDSQDKQPYRWSTRVTSVTPGNESNDQVTVSFRWKDTDNATENRAASLMGPNGGNGNGFNDVTGGNTITFTNIDGVWKISNDVYFAG